MMISSFVCSLEFISERSGRGKSFFRKLCSVPSAIALGKGKGYFPKEKVSPGPEAGPFNEL